MIICYEIVNQYFVAKLYDWLQMELKSLIVLGGFPQLHDGA